MKFAKSAILSSLCFLLLNVNSGNAQDRFEYPQSVDLGMNITSLISSFIGNINTIINPETFPVAIKISRKKTAWRFGLGFTLDNSDADLLGVEQFVFNNFTVNSRFGFERKKYLGHKIGIVYGIDFVGQILNREDIVSNDVDVSNISENGFSIGGGPVYGFEYYFNKKIYFGAEGSFYTLYTKSNRKQIFRFNSGINSERIIHGLRTDITPPARLYVMVRF